MVLELVVPGVVECNPLGSVGWACEELEGSEDDSCMAGVEQRKGYTLVQELLE